MSQNDHKYRSLISSIGANPSAEEGDEALDSEGPKSVNNVVHSFRLQQTSFDKKTFLAYLKVRDPYTLPPPMMPLRFVFLFQGLHENSESQTFGN